MIHKINCKPVHCVQLIFIFCISLIANISHAQYFEQAVSLEVNSIKESLKSTPAKKSIDLKSSDVKIQLPYLDGKILSFHVLENKLMSDEFSRAFPSIKTYKILSEDLRIKGRMTVGGGLIYCTFFNEQGMLKLSPNKNSALATDYILSKNHKSSSDLIEDHICGGSLETSETIKIEENKSKSKSSTAIFDNGADLRDFDLAIVCTGEFYVANGDETVAVNTVITDAVNAIEEIYENELSVNFTLLSPFLYTDASTDPFDNSTSRVNMAADAVDTNFAVGTYDIGHVFHDSNEGAAELGSGGIAYLGVICDDGIISGCGGDCGHLKAGGWSSASDNTSTSFYRVAAHEFGHMFGARHTFNGNGGFGGNCNGGNHPSATAYEIGSGNTIMSYRGLCDAAQNTPSSGLADNYFHVHSLEEMIDEMEATNCYSTTASGNAVPVVDAGSDYTIPISTPFELTATATDGDGDEMTYVWEQYNEDDEVYGSNSTNTHGMTGATAAADSGAPLFRSYPPSSSLSREFPIWTSIADGNNTGLTFEALPSVGRTMNFRFTARDNKESGGAVAIDEMAITVEGGAGPFEITSQGTAQSWTANGTNVATITWDEASTDLSPINATTVDIYFSVDGGNTFPYLLESAVSNDGSEDIVIPYYPTSIGRIKVKATNNIFYDVNDADIEINSSTCLANGATFSPSNDVSFEVGTSSLELNLSADYGVVISTFIETLETTDTPSNLAFEGSTGSCSGPSNSNVADSFTFQVDADATYTFSKSSGSYVLNLYEMSFDVNSVCTNWLASSGVQNTAGGPVTLGGSVSSALDAGITYVLAVTSFSASTPTLPLAYTITPSGSGSLYDGVPDPGASYTYTFVIVDNSTGNIAGFESDGDMSNDTNYPVGTYKVYGLSYESAGTLPAVGTSFSTFQSDIALLSPCGNLSSNCITVEVTSTSCAVDYAGGNALSGSISGLEDYETDGDIESTQTIEATAKVDYDSGNSILLENDFEVKAGAEFCILIDGCNGGAGGLNLKEEEEESLAKKGEKEEEVEVEKEE